MLLFDSEERFKLKPFNLLHATQGTQLTKMKHRNKNYKILLFHTRQRPVLRISLPLDELIFKKKNLLLKCVGKLKTNFRLYFFRYRFPCKNCFFFLWVGSGLASPILIKFPTIVLMNPLSFRYFELSTHKRIILLEQNRFCNCY